MEAAVKERIRQHEAEPPEHEQHDDHQGRIGGERGLASLVALQAAGDREPGRPRLAHQGRAEPDASHRGPRHHDRLEDVVHGDAEQQRAEDDLDDVDRAQPGLLRSGSDAVVSLSEAAASRLETGGIVRVLSPRDVVKCGSKLGKRIVWPPSCQQWTRPAGGLPTPLPSAQMS